MKIISIAFLLASSVFSQQCTVGQFKCNNDGIDAGFTYCDESGASQKLACGEGTVCKQNGEQVYCGWPRGTYVNHFLDELSLLNLQLSELGEFPTPTESPELASQVESLVSYIEGQIVDVKSRIEQDLGEPIGTSVLESEVSELETLTSDLREDISTIIEITEVTATTDVTNPTDLSADSEADLAELPSDLSVIARAASVVGKPKKVIQTTDFAKQIRDQRGILEQIEFATQAANLASKVSKELKKSKGKHDARNIKSLAKDIHELAKIAGNVVEPTISA